MAKINSYLNFNGNTEEVFNFYKTVFGGEFVTLQRFKDTPAGANIPEGEQNKIMHVALPIGDNLLMGTDVGQNMPPVTFGTNSSLCVDAKSEEDANKLFNGLAAGGKISMPLEKMFWDALFGMLTDKFGVQWMINYSLHQPK